MVSYAPRGQSQTRPGLRPQYIPTPRAEKVLLGAFYLSTFGLLLSNKVVLFGDLSAIVIAACVAAARGNRSRYSLPLATSLYVLILFYILASFGSNFPGWYPALLGVRKTVPPFIFLVAGSLWPRDGARLVRSVLFLLLAACAASLVLHNLVPSVEDAVNRKANQYTGLYAGVPRLQGVFAGPFHVALAGLTLVLASAGLPGIWRNSALRFAAAAVGVTVLLEASVRSGWLALAGGLLTLTFFRRQRVPRVVRVAAVLSAGGVVLLGNLQAVLFQSNAALESLTHWQSDSRLLNRFASYREALSLVGRHPLFGWGPGSAADTLDRYFQNGVHVTAHNMLLAYAVEIGLVGAAAVVAMLVTSGFALCRLAATSAVGAWGFSLLVAFLVFGASGTAVDAAPVSSLVFLLVGLAMSSSPELAQPRGMARAGEMRHAQQ